MIRENTSIEMLQQIVEGCPAGTIIGEFAGRDSVAAIMEALKGPEVTHVLPVVTFAPTEYGSEKELEVNHIRMIEQVQQRYGEKKKIYPLVYYSSLPLWRMLNGRFVTTLQEAFGFYTPCIGCHVYFHLARIPLAAKLGGKIIAGERESHGGKIKVNQLDLCLNSYQRILKTLGIDLLLPIRFVESGEEVEKLIGWNWAAEEQQPVCLFSGNYRDSQGRAIYNLEKLNRFLSDFLEPLSIHLGKHYLENPGMTEEEMKMMVEEKMKTMTEVWEAKG